MMQIINQTPHSTPFLRRMVAWCARQIGLPIGHCSMATFKNARRAFSGCCRGSRIIVRIGQESRFPTREYRTHGIMHAGFADRLEALIGVTSHELLHVGQLRANPKQRNGAGLEVPAMAAERQCVEAFRKDRDSLLAAWLGEPIRMAAEPLDQHSA